tara:strand:+ start:42 stop:470 length:429 start_codon:yes stop_codon:yes gene_type:complete
MAFKMKGIKNFGEGTPLFSKKLVKKETGPRAEKKYDSGETGNDLFIARSTEVKDPKTGENLTTERMKDSGEKKNYRIPVTRETSGKDMGLYTVTSDKGKKVVVNPAEKTGSIAPSSVIKGVKPGGDYQKAFRKYNKSRGRKD